MDRVNVPGFTAEASLRNAAQRCRAAGSNELARTGGLVRPQLRRPRGPFGPIGLPGQDCAGACMHICMSFGGWSYDRCMQDCLSTCSGPAFSARGMMQM